MEETDYDPSERVLNECIQNAFSRSAITTMLKNETSKYETEPILTILKRIRTIIDAAEVPALERYDFLGSLLALFAFRRPLRDFSATAQQFMPDTSLTVTMTAFNVVLFALKVLAESVDAFTASDRDHLVSTGTFGALCTMLQFMNRGVLYSKTHTKAEGPRPRPETVAELSAHYGVDITDLPSAVTGGMLTVPLGQARRDTLKVLANAVSGCVAGQTFIREANMLVVVAASVTDDPHQHLCREWGMLLARNTLEGSDANYEAMGHLMEGARDTPIVKEEGEAPVDMEDMA